MTDIVIRSPVWNWMAPIKTTMAHKKGREVERIKENIKERGLFARYLNQGRQFGIGLHHKNDAGTLKGEGSRKNKGEYRDIPSRGNICQKPYSDRQFGIRLHPQKRRWHRKERGE